jgi:ketosteroid isomerase-like protein
MTAQSTTRFDTREFARAYAQWDIDTLRDLYTEDVEIVQIDRDNPPSAPRFRHGREALRGQLVLDFKRT